MAFEKSLFERIQHSEEGEQYKLSVDTNKVADSVMEHLRNMLNSRQGSVPALPDYGLPDFNDMVARFPDAIFELRRAIKTCIEKYEPRLARVKVDHIPDEENPLNLRYEITAQLISGDESANVWFETTLDSAGKVSVRG
jgi:type VI secretion system protein